MAVLLHGDCLEIMKTLPDKSIDLFLCDLPYGSVGCAWDQKIDLSAFWEQVKRLATDDHTPVIMFCSTKFGFELYNSNPDWFRYDLVWNKSRGVSFLSANKMPLRCHEMMYVFAKKGANYYRTDYVGDFPAYVGSHSAAKVYDLPKPDKEGYKKVDNGKRCVKSVVSINNESNKNNKHPTQKPAELYEWLITRYSKEGDTILDPTAGSFSSVFTAERLGRHGIGIEMDDAFYEKALEKNTEKE
jgi:site-specific DNA-methyltransferase (adenine-specific)